MKTPETIYHQLIDSFTQRDVCFALYRLPWTDEPILVMQEEGEPVSRPVSADNFPSGSTHSSGYCRSRLGGNQTGLAKMDGTSSATCEFMRFFPSGQTA